VSTAEGGRGRGRGGKEEPLSYFSDFIFMQQLMTLEIDLIFGQANDNIGLLKPVDQGDEEGDSDSEREGSKPIATLNFGSGPKEDMEPASNRRKLKALEDRLAAFVALFGAGNEDGPNANDTIQD